MTSLVEVAKLVREGNQTSEESNKHLQSLDSAFNKFFKIQENDRLDRLEDRLDAARTRRVTATSTGRSAGSGAIATAAGAATGLMGNLKDFLLFLANPLGWVKLLARATFGLGAAVVGASYKALRNVIDDRLKTQRGLLRIEAKQLKDAQAAEKKAIQTKITAEQKATNDAKRDMKARINAAEKQFKIDQDKAARAEAVRRARLDFEMQRERLLRARELKREQAKYQRRLNAAISGSSPSTLKAVVADGRANFSSTAPDSSVVRKTLPVMVTPDAISGAMDSSVSTDTLNKPGVQTNTTGLSVSNLDANTTKIIRASDRLKVFSDAELNRAGVYRQTNSLGADQYKRIVDNTYVKHLDLVKQLELNRTSGKTGGLGTTSLRVAGFALDPYSAVVQEGLEYGARSTAGTASRIFGGAAKMFGSVGFNAALLSIMPSAAADGSISGPFQRLYENMIAALIEGDPRNVIAARDHMREYVDKVAGGNLNLVTSSAEILGLSDYILGASEQELKAFTGMQYAQRTGKIFRRNPAPEGVASGKVVGRERGLIGDELNALDAVSERNYQMGMPPSINPVNNTTNNYKIDSPGASGMGSTSDGNDKLMEAMSIQ